MGGTEIELKLTLPPEGLEKLKRLPVLKARRQGRATSARLRATYFDTAGQDMANAGISVRLRHDGRRLIQTVKTAGNRASGLFARQEWENEVAGPGLDTARLAATGLPAFQDEALCAALRPVFTTEVTRTTQHLRGDEWHIEMSLDKGEIRAGDAREPVSEAELELKAGKPSHLFALAREVAAHLPVRLGSTSKSDRGFALAGALAPRAVKASPVDLAADATLAEAFRTIARNCAQHLLANEQALLVAEDGEAVHQMRVALRRLRSAFKVFKPLVDGAQLASLRGEIAWLLGALSPARDAEVFLTGFLEPLAIQFPNHPGVIRLRDQWRTERDGRVRAARAAVAEPRFTRLLLELGTWIDSGDWCSDPALPGPALSHTPARPFAARTLNRLARKMRKAGGEKLKRLTPEDLHRVRIHGKRLRYAAEFLSTMFRKDRPNAREYLTTLATLQDRLGELNDIAVAAPLLAAHHHPSETAWAAGLAIGWHEARRPALMEAAQEHWEAFRALRKFWR
jgi:inorganic triphosphatase YgiF